MQRSTNGREGLERARRLDGQEELMSAADGYKSKATIVHDK